MTLLAEQLGRGTNRVIAECQDYGIAPPTFEERQGFLLVTFRARLATGPVTPQVTARISTAKNAANTKMKKRGHRSAAFTPLQRASDLGEIMSADVRTVKRTKVRAPVPVSAISAVE